MHTKTFCFDKDKCKPIDEIDHDTQVSSTVQFKEPGKEGYRWE